ncbi:MAG: hypothetical protein M3092_00725 [Actinomycetia bacterium]|nr:hypothetical protein [Actinomycetes bacterium]
MEDSTEPPQSDQGETFSTKVKAITGLIIAVGTVITAAALFYNPSPSPDTPPTTHIEAAATTTVPSTTPTSAATDTSSGMTQATKVATATEPPSTTLTTVTSSTTTTTEPPLNVFVEADPAIFIENPMQGFSYVFTGTLGQVGAPPSDDCRTWHNWAMNIGGADSGGSLTGPMFQLSMTTTTDHTILIDGFTVEVTRRDPPVHGLAVFCPVGGAALLPRLIQLDLDVDPPVVTYLAPTSDHYEARDFSFSIAPGEIEIFEVSAVTTDCDCDWTGTVHYVDIASGERGTIEITNDGEPFRTSASRNASSYLWTGDWTPWSQS